MPWSVEMQLMVPSPKLFGPTVAGEWLLVDLMRYL
jgi:hypothetical protein